MSYKLVQEYKSNIIRIEATNASRDLKDQAHKLNDLLYLMIDKNEFKANKMDLKVKEIIKTLNVRLQGE
jgi:hypothetical protein